MHGESQGVAMSLLIFADYSSEIVALVLTYLVGAGTNINVLLNTVRKYLRVAGIERTIAMAGGVRCAGRSLVPGVSYMSCCCAGHERQLLSQSHHHPASCRSHT